MSEIMNISKYHWKQFIVQSDSSVIRVCARVHDKHEVVDLYATPNNFLHRIEKPRVKVKYIYIYIYIYILHIKYIINNICIYIYIIMHHKIVYIKTTTVKVLPKNISKHQKHLKT